MQTDITLYGIAAVPLCVALVEVAKASGLSSRFAPLASLALGILAGLAAQQALPHPNYIAGVVAGIAVGLAASGAYSGIARIVQPDSTPLPAAVVTSTMSAGAPVTITPATPADPAPGN